MKSCPINVDNWDDFLIKNNPEYSRNTKMHVRGHKHPIPTKFRKHPSSESLVKADYVFQYIYMH